MEKEGETAMNVYDFDNTIYSGDSTIDFCVWCMKKYPKCLIAVLLTTPYFIGYKFKMINLSILKERFYSFLQYVPNVTEEINLFWDKNEHKISRWYLNQKNNRDVVITASPEFLVQVECNRLNIGCVGSKVDLYTGKLLGENCKGVEKVKRFKELYPNVEIDSFYSDSKSDEPLASIAKEAFLVKNGRIKKWCFLEEQQ